MKNATSIENTLLATIPQTAEKIAEKGDGKFLEALLVFLGALKKANITFEEKITNGTSYGMFKLTREAQDIWVAVRTWETNPAGNNNIFRFAVKKRRVLSAVIYLSHNGLFFVLPVKRLVREPSRKKGSNKTALFFEGGITHTFRLENLSDCIATEEKPLGDLESLFGEELAYEEYLRQKQSGGEALSVADSGQDKPSEECTGAERRGVVCGRENETPDCGQRNASEITDLACFAQIIAEAVSAAMEAIVGKLAEAMTARPLSSEAEALKAMAATPRVTVEVGNLFVVTVGSGAGTDAAKAVVEAVKSLMSKGGEEEKEGE